MSHEMQEWTAHQEHILLKQFFKDCTYCEIIKEFGIWQSGEFVTFEEMESWKGTNDGMRIQEESA